MNKLAGKIAAVCLAAVMAGTLLSAAAFASEAETNSNDNEISALASTTNAAVVNSDQNWEDCEMTGDVYVQKDVTLTLSGTSTIDGDVYVFGTLRNTGKLTVTGTLHCLHYGSMMSAGNYDYGYFINSGTASVSVLDVTSGYLDTEIPTVEENDNADDETGTDEETVADYTTCPGVAISVTIKRSYYIDENYTFTSADGAAVSAVSTGIAFVVDSSGSHYDKTYRVTITEPGYHVITVKGQSTGASLTFTVDVSHNISYFEKVEPTCTEDGHEPYYQCTVCKTMFADEDGNEEISSASVIIPAFGHDWQEPEWTWSEDYSAATISRICNTCGTVETKDATVTSTTTATCTEPGETTYTASVTLDGEEYNDLKIAETEALGHDWGDMEWTWSEDHTSATASRTCKNCGAEETFDAIVSGPTEDENGSIVYTATITTEDGTELTDTYIEPAEDAEEPDGNGDSEEAKEADSDEASGNESDSDTESTGLTSGDNTGTAGTGSSGSGTTGNTGSSGSSSGSGSSAYSPQTDDPVNLTALWLIVAGFALAGCAALAFYKARGAKKKTD